MLDGSSSKLATLVQNEDYVEALNLIKTLFNQDKKARQDSNLVHCKVYCLIQNGAFYNAAQIIESLKSTQPELFQSLKFEHAYSLYKLNCFGRALSIVNLHRAQLALVHINDTNEYKEIPVNWNNEEDQKFALLEAQLLYRLALYSESFQLYKQFYEQSPDDHLIAVNLQACCACLGGSNGNVFNNPYEVASTSYEAAFNAACVAIEEGDVVKAQDFLTLAEDLWNNSEDADKSDYRSIILQRAYLDQLRNKSTTALDVYKETLSSPSDEVDSVSLVVARNNMVAITGEISELPTFPGVPNWFFLNCVRQECEKDYPIRFSQMTSGFRSNTSLRLARQQIVSLVMNSSLAMLKANRLRECRRYIDAVDQVPLVFIAQFKAILDIAGNRSEAAVAQLINASRNTLSSKLKCQLLISALILSIKSSNNELSLQITNSIAAEVLVKGGLDADVLILAFRLIESVNPKRFATLLDEMRSLLLDGNISDGRLSVLNALAEMELRCGHFESAYKLFSKIQELEGSVTATIGQLRSSARYNFEIAKKALSKLQTEKKDLFTNQSLALIDPDDVVAMRIQLDRRSVRTATELLKLFNSSRVLSSAVEEIQKKNEYILQGGVKEKRRRKRKPRYPKGFDPKNPGPPPDPERWLPKYERTTFKKTKRGHIKTFRGAQGVSNVIAGEVGTGKKTASTANVEIKKETTRRSGILSVVVGEDIEEVF